MNEITDFFGGSRTKINIPRVEPVVKPVPPAEVSHTSTVPVVPPTVEKPYYKYLILECGECGSKLSVGKNSSNAKDKLHLKCPVCGTDYVKQNYVVDSNSVLFHRPFVQEQQAQFDEEINRLSKSVKVHTEILKKDNN